MNECPYCGENCPTDDCMTVYTPIKDCEHRCVLDGCCTHPKATTPECHVNACIRLHPKLVFQWNAGVEKLKTKTEHPLVEFRKRPYGGGPIFSDGFIGGRPFEFRCDGASMRVNVAASSIETPYEGAAWTTVERGDFNRASVLECEKFIHLAAALWKKRKPL